MALYNREIKLSEAIMSHPSLLPVVDRLGIRLGVGDATIGEVCDDRGIDPDFFLSVINTFLDEEYFPVNARGTFTIEKTVAYLRKTNAYYLRVQLPNIDRHFKSLIDRSGDDNNLDMLRTFYQDMRMQMTESLRYDDEVLFPALSSGRVEVSSESAVAGYMEVEEKLHDLLYFFVEHLRGNYDANLCTAVVSAVFSLERDLCQNNRIRSRILLPLISGATAF
ncbi:helix-turn-helix transcriptional regulator [Lepagella muris]|uniref:Helix-turn-helix transcriptional regulator n=1 Tax=Lepagella muris TaxID=3032870 RepID=A0AC61RGA1_9BACT|nr:helix-turn-helix transcriptional regulator [Lepagella muris]TGY78456.1 helix-turn-helix transcriptional regulator [Lepagella muris]THG53668.1 helix-turn-helix transcriptional regulator [Bacteroidales bacterium]TKC66127.1 helix-turn-helix transcriptional regulator [Bacteroidales bacterium]